VTERRQERSSEESEETAITFLSMGPKTSTSPAGVGGRESGTGRVIAALKTAADRADQLERTRVSRDRSVLSGGGLLAHEAPCHDVDQAHGAGQETGQERPDTHRSHRHVPGLGQTAADTTEDAVLGDWRVILFFSYAQAPQVTHELRSVRAAFSALRRVGAVQVRCDGLDVV